MSPPQILNDLTGTVKQFQKCLASGIMRNIFLFCEHSCHFVLDGFDIMVMLPESCAWSPAGPLSGRADPWGSTPPAHSGANRPATGGFPRDSDPANKYIYIYLYIPDCIARHLFKVTNRGTYAHSHLTSFRRVENEFSHFLNCPDC